MKENERSSDRMVGKDKERGKMELSDKRCIRNDQKMDNTFTHTFPGTVVTFSWRDFDLLSDIFLETSIMFAK